MVGSGSACGFLRVVRFAFGQVSFRSCRVGLGFILGWVQALLWVWSRVGLGFLGHIFIGFFGFIEGMFNLYFGQVYGLVWNLEWFKFVLGLVSGLFKVSLDCSGHVSGLF